jgi:beta-aspartyl-peptidase (threonine type)
MPDPQQTWTLVIHGGAGVLERARMTAELEAKHRAGLEAALQAGSAVLAEGGSALDAVEAAARSLEDNPLFNAGHGAVLTYDGHTELDAAIMDGRARDAGAVTGVSATKNPISLARAVMEKSPHVMLASKGADRFAIEQGLEQADPDYFDLPERRRQLGGAQGERQRLVRRRHEVRHDRRGRAGRARPRRGGDLDRRHHRQALGPDRRLPADRRGTWADDRSCASRRPARANISSAPAVAHEIAARMRHLGESARPSADAVMADVGGLGGNGGVIVVSAGGEPVFSFNSEGMYRGIATPAGRSVAIYGDE